MKEMGVGQNSPSGVFVFDEFRDNLIIDRYDPVFTQMRGSKLRHMHSENSEDALTWNVFRSLRQIDASLWFGRLAELSFGTHMDVDPRELTVKLWQNVSPPPSLLRFQGDEGESEIDICLETPDLVWFIEAKYKSDISTRTTSNEHRNQVLRNIDVGSYYAGTRRFYFSLLVLEESRSPRGVAAVREYEADYRGFRDSLAHRQDGCANVSGIGLLHWAALASALASCSECATREEEREYARRALEWLRGRGIERDEGHAG